MWKTLSTQKNIVKIRKKRIKKYLSTYNSQLIHIKTNTYPHFVDKNVDKLCLTRKHLFTIIMRGMKT